MAIHPGELEKILRAELDRYFDHGLARRGERAARELRAELDRIEADVLAGHADEVGAIRARYAEVLAEIDAIHADAKPLWQAITTALNDAAPDVEDLDWPEPRAGDEDPDPLFDSTRDYVDQIEAYKRFQGQPTERRERIAGGVRGLVKRRKEERQRRLLKNGGGDGEGGS